MVHTPKKKDRNKKFSPSSSNSSANSTTGLISKLPKQTNIKKVHKMLQKISQKFRKEV